MDSHSTSEIMDDSQDLNLVAASDNRINFFRLTRIVLDNIPHTLRIVFSDKYTEKYGTSWQVAFGKPLSHHIKCRFKDQQHLVASGDLQKWDSTILCNVLLDPSWQLSKLESDAIKELQKIRNTCFAHRAEATVSSQELYDIVQDIEKAYKDMKIPPSEISEMKDIEKETIAQSDLVKKLRDAEERMENCHSHDETVRDQMIVDLVLSVTDQLRTSLKEDIHELRSDMEEMEEKVDKLEERISELSVGSSCDIPQRIGEKKHIAATIPEYVPSAVTKRHRRKLQREKVSFDSDDETSGFEDISVKVTENEFTQDENDGNEEVKMKGVYEPFYSTSADEPISSSMQDTDSTIIDEQISSSVQDTGNKMQFENEPISCSEGQQQTVGSTQTSDKSQVQMSNCLVVSAAESGNTFKAKQDRIDELEGEIEEYKRKLEDAEVRLDVLSQEKESLQQQLNEESSSNESLRQELLAKENEESQLRKSKCDLENKLVQMNEQLARIKEQHELQLKNKDLEMEIMKLRASEEKRKEMDELFQKCLKLEAKNEILEAERSRCSETKSDIVSIGNLRINNAEELGHGAFGTVFKGLWEGKDCAIKMLHYAATSMVMLGSITLPETTQHKECDMAAVKSFNKECEHLKSLKHPNIVELLTILQKQGRPIIVMELLDCNLGEYILTRFANNDLQKLTQLSMSYQLSAGLEYLHQKKIVHRDLCGDNVLIKLQDPIPIAKISDFGTSKMVDEENQRRSFSMQVPYRAGYLPPEIEKNPRSFDSSIDVFMYGVVSLQIVHSVGCVRDREHRYGLLAGIPDHPLKGLITACIVEKERRPSAQDIAHRAKQVYYEFEIAASQ